MVLAVDPFWLVVVGVSLVSLLLVSGWPDQTGQASDSLTLGLVVMLGVTVHVSATRHAETTSSRIRCSRPSTARRPPNSVQVRLG
jgi:hypothetical protein